MIYSLQNNNASVKIENNNIIVKFIDFTHGDFKDLHSFLDSPINKDLQLRAAIINVEALIEKNIKINDDDFKYVKKFSEKLTLSGRELLVLIPCSASDYFSDVLLASKETGLKHILCASSAYEAIEIASRFKYSD